MNSQKVMRCRNSNGRKSKKKMSVASLSAEGQKQYGQHNKMYVKRQLECQTNEMKR